MYNKLPNNEEKPWWASNLGPIIHSEIVGCKGKNMSRIKPKEQIYQSQTKK